MWPGGAAVNGSGLTGSGLTIRSTLFEGTLSGAAADTSRFIVGGSADSASTGPAQFDFRPPSSVLVGKADAELTRAVDFNERPRVSPFDVGACETEAWPPIRAGELARASSRAARAAQRRRRLRRI